MYQAADILYPTKIGITVNAVEIIDTPQTVWSMGQAQADCPRNKLIESMYRMSEINIDVNIIYWSFKV